MICLIEIILKRRCFIALLYSKLISFRFHTFFLFFFYPRRLFFYFHHSIFFLSSLFHFAYKTRRFTNYNFISSVQRRDIAEYSMKGIERRIKIEERGKSLRKNYEKNCWKCWQVEKFRRDMDETLILKVLQAIFSLTFSTQTS